MHTWKLEFQDTHWSISVWRNILPGESTWNSKSVNPNLHFCTQTSASLMAGRCKLCPGLSGLIHVPPLCQHTGLDLICWFVSFKFLPPPSSIYRPTQVILSLTRLYIHAQSFLFHVPLKEQNSSLILAPLSLGTEVKFLSPYGVLCDMVTSVYSVFTQPPKESCCC